MNLSDLGKEIAKYSPLVGSLLPIPGGAVIGQLIANLFGGDINKPQDLLNKIQADPDAVLKFKQFEKTNELDKLKVALEEHRLNNEDKENARGRELDYIKTTGKEDRTQKNIAYIVTFGFFGALFLLFFPTTDINQTEKTLLTTLIAMLATKFATIADYYFGSSSLKKDH